MPAASGCTTSKLRSSLWIFRIVSRHCFLFISCDLPCSGRHLTFMLTSHVNSTWLGPVSETYTICPAGVLQFAVDDCASVTAALSVCHRKSWCSGIWASGNPLARVPSTQWTNFGDNQYPDECQRKCPRRSLNLAGACEGPEVEIRTARQSGCHRRVPRPAVHGG
jgi:hypothetical protein